MHPPHSPTRMIQSLNPTIHFHPCTHPLTYSVTHLHSVTLTHSILLSYPCTHSCTHALSHSATHSLHPHVLFPGFTTLCRWALSAVRVYVDFRPPIATPRVAKTIDVLPVGMPQAGTLRRKVVLLRSGATFVGAKVWGKNRQHRWRGAGYVEQSKLPAPRPSSA